MRLVWDGLRLKGLTEDWRFEVGDWAVEGEDRLSEEAYQYFGPFRQEAIWQYVRVAKRFPDCTRVQYPSLSWSHFRLVASLPPPEAAQALLRAEVEKLSSRALGDALRPSVTPPEKHACPECGAIHRRAT